MRKTTLSVLVAALVAALSATAVVADPQSRPNGPWVQDSQKLSYASTHDYDEMVRDLRKLENRSRGAMELEVIGKSNEGRDLYLARVGTGPKKVMIVTQQHGDEVHGTEAALHFLNSIIGSKYADLREEVTVLVLPKINPDGSDRIQRQNHDPGCVDPFCLEGVGYDMNRFHDPAMPLDENPVPEAVAMREAHARYQPDVVLDYHNQFSYVSDDGDMITMSLMWPLNENVDPQVVDDSKRATAIIAGAVSDYAHAEVTKFPGGTAPAIGRNAYGLLGSATVLIEQRGQEEMGQKGIGYLVKQAYVSMFSVVQALADGTFDEVDPAEADALPERGDRIRNPNDGE